MLAAFIPCSAVVAAQNTNSEQGRKSDRISLSGCRENLRDLGTDGHQSRWAQFQTALQKAIGNEAVQFEETYPPQLRARYQNFGRRFVRRLVKQFMFVIQA